MASRRHAISKNSGSPPGRLRIVAGKWKSRLLPVVHAEGLRPTSERVRETLFNWLAPVIEGSTCLDLFAGTGALGFEALSRGAGTVTFVERSGSVARTLKANIDMLDAAGATMIQGDAFSYLESSSEQRFDVVFLDPPFADEKLDELCRLLDENERLAPGAHVYIEQGRSQPPPTLPDGWNVLREKEAGQVRYSLAGTGGTN